MPQLLVDVENHLPYNDKIKINPKEMDLIENALRNVSPTSPDFAACRKLLASLHHQKTPYRPKKGIYVSG